MRDRNAISAANLTGQGYRLPVLRNTVPSQLRIMATDAVVRTIKLAMAVARKAKSTFVMRPHP